MAVDKDTAELAAFEEFLEVHGARAERWPEAARERFRPLLERNARARELLAEARVLETLLDRAPLPSADRTEPLANRIVAVAAAEKANQPSTGNVIDLAARRQARTMLMPRSRWQVASALAASLLVGIYLGASPPVTSAIETIAAAVGLEDEAEDSDLVLMYSVVADEEELI